MDEWLQATATATATAQANLSSCAVSPESYIKLPLSLLIVAGGGSISASGGAAWQLAATLAIVACNWQTGKRANALSRRLRTRTPHKLTRRQLASVCKIPQSSAPVPSHALCRAASIKPQQTCRPLRSDLKSCSCKRCCRGNNCCCFFST